MFCNCNSMGGMDELQMIRIIIIALLLTSCSANKKDINPWTTIVRQVLTNGMSR